MSDSTYVPLNGATFTVYYADKQTVVKVTTTSTDGFGNVTTSTEKLENLTSGASGVFWVGELPYGTYYLEETAPTKENGTGTTAYSNNAGKWFYLVVGDDVVMSMGYADRDAAKAGYESYKSGSDTTP